MSRPVSDQHIREEALNVSWSFILEAPAGSGKTAILIARFLALLAKVSHPRQIMAVTYTRKAAAEMLNRITEVLRRVQRGGETPDDPWDSFLFSLGRKAIERHRENAEVLLDPESLNVGTFHSVCASIVKAWPFEANVPPGVKILEDQDQESLLELAVERYLHDLVSGKAAGEEREACERYLASLNNSVPLLSGQLMDILKRRDQLEDFIPLFSTERRESAGSELERRLEGYAGLFLSELREYFIKREEGWGSLKRALADGGVPFGGIFPDTIPGTGLHDIASWKKASQVLLTKSKKIRKRVSTADGFPRDFDKHPSARFIKQLPSVMVRLLASVAGWPDPGGDNVGMASLADLLLLIGGALVRFENLIHERGMDYLELELAAQRALRTVDRPSESLIFYHEHLRHILVDEAQDLNNVQVKILGKLTEGWDPADGRTVFFVGDPKQSIYRFRRAVVSIFSQLKEDGLPREGERFLPLTHLILTANFRSQPHLVTFANRLFSEVMASPRKEYDEVDFTVSEAARSASEGCLTITGAVFYHDGDTHQKSLSPREREARWVAASVSQLHEERQGDTIGILIRARNYLSPYIEALSDYGVPVCLMEGIPLLDRPEVRHLLNLFTAMIRPYDDVAWAGSIRAPWLYVSDQVLVSLKPAEGLWSKAVLSGKDVSQDIARFAEAVEEAKAMFGREPYASTLQRLWEDLDGPRMTAARYGAAGVSNARAFLDLLNRVSGLQGEEALSRVSRLAEASYTPPDPNGAFSPVHMMTIHKAKGLEFHHVFAVNLDYDPLSGGRGEQPAYRIEQLPGDERHVLISATGDRRTGEDNLAYYLLKDLDRQRTLAEARRLFYVVATRARESLTLTGVSKPPEKWTWEGDPRTSLDWLLKVGTGEGISVPAFSFFTNPAPPDVAVGEEEVRCSPAPLPSFNAEPLPYRIVSPSRVEDETSLAVAPGAEEEDEDARARGVVIHRILDTFARGGNHPDLQAIIAALTEEGISPDDASGMANDILKESNSAWETPEFKNLCRSATDLHSEWAIEDYDGEYSLRVGRVDLLVKTGDRWLIVDYKTGRPDGDVASWVHAQVQHYHPQLTAYAQMVARVMNVPEEKVTWTILFTAIPRLVWQGK